jgi:hypothetical protein
MNPRQATWEEQLAGIKQTLQAAREDMKNPRPRRGRKHRAKIVPDTRPADVPVDLRKEEREYEEAERQARIEQAEITRNPYGNNFYPVDR